MNNDKTQQQDLYKILGVTEQATAAEIKSAYRSKAKEWHPDMNKTSVAPKMFQAIQQAYDVLSNEESRRQYDYSRLPAAHPMGFRQTVWRNAEGVTIIRTTGNFTGHYTVTVNGKEVKL